MQRDKEGKGKVRKEILREEKAKRKVEVRQTKVERKEKKEKTVKNKRSGLDIFLFLFLNFILFSIYFPLFYF